jgi:hypothetical protein
MKKIISLLAVAMLFVLATNAQAADNWAGESVTGTYNANVYCIPGLEGVALLGNLGTFFQGTTAVALTTPGTGENFELVWKLKGPHEATYTVEFGGLVYPGKTEFYSYEGDVDSKITGTWWFGWNNGATAFHELGYNGRTFNLQTMGNGNAIPFGCETPVAFKFVAEEIFPGNTFGTKTFIVSLRVSATI